VLNGKLFTILEPSLYSSIWIIGAITKKSNTKIEMLLRAILILFLLVFLMIIEKARTELIQKLRPKDKFFEKRVIQMNNRKANPRKGITNVARFIFKIEFISFTEKRNYFVLVIKIT